MDVTPRELRDTEISSEFRGYDRDEVNDLLERAAATIEGLSERVRILSDRLSAAQNDPARAAALSETPSKTLELAQRTLEMAQQSAEEEITRAREEADHTIREAETRARILVVEAEAEARRRCEVELEQMTEQVTQLTADRDLLIADVSSLERFEREYRDRLERAIEADLGVVRSRGTARPADEPELQSMEIVEGGWIAAGGDTDADASGDAAEAPAGALGSADAPGEPALARAEADDAFADVPPPPPGDTTIDLPLAEAEPPERPLPDDAFFTSLRDAVREDAPLDPGEERFFEEAANDSSTIRDVFRRRR